MVIHKAQRDTIDNPPCSRAQASNAYAYCMTSYIYGNAPTPTPFGHTYIKTSLKDAPWCTN